VDKPVAARFGQNLLAARRRAGLVQTELAQQSCLHPTYVSHMEQGMRLARIDTVVRLACALDVGMGELVRGIEWSPPAPAAPPPTGSFRLRPERGV
jgi:transcriptional regulator with XRE-family HTH domain